MSNPFSRSTAPDLYHTPGVGEVYRTVAEGPKEATPARDVRYPAYAATLSDGRLVTDYRPQCTKNIPAGKQFHTKHWMIQHASELMEEARQRHVEWTGASLPMANTVPPPAGIVYSTPFQSDLRPTYLRDGIGIERSYSTAPPLFGTFTYEPTMAELRANRKETQLTTFMEGGRNTIRGRK